MEKILEKLEGRPDGWALSLSGFQDLHNKVLNVLSRNRKKINILEFGSGVSTQFFILYGKERNINIELDSFDNDEKYAFFDEHENLNLMIRRLVDCTTKDLDLMFEKKSLDRTKFFDAGVTIPHEDSKKRNCFYDIRNGDLKEYYDLVVLDGPTGQGRRVSFLHIKEHVKAGTYIFIDDISHYDFLERMKKVFENVEFVSGNKEHEKHVYSIYKIL